MNKIKMYIHIERKKNELNLINTSWENERF
jgi:hypothetical protein